ncbi:hypothetical protein IIB51_00855 [Patescibacteria group bacterium]|nr:hypothetical protein [Patescibacteria group bacterium]MCH8889259.1 hypothetical protein [Patescibacteria group bacterium]
MANGEDLKTLLKKNLDLTRENNVLLRKMRRMAIYGNIIKVVWLAIIIGLPVYIYYAFLQPYVGQALEIYSGVETGVGGIRNFLDKLPFLGNFGGE